MNYPIRYAPMQLLQELKHDDNGVIEYKIIGYLAVKCYLISETKIYHSNDKYSMKYQVVFTIKNTDLANNIYTEQEPDINVKRICVNSEFVNFISEDFESCKERADYLNKNMIILYNPPRIVDMKMKEHNELVNSYYELIKKENNVKTLLK